MNIPVNHSVFTLKETEISYFGPYLNKNQVDQSDETNVKFENLPYTINIDKKLYAENEPYP